MTPSDKPTNPTQNNIENLYDEYESQARSIFKDAQEYWSLKTPAQGNDEEVIESIAAALRKLGEERDRLKEILLLRDTRVCQDRTELSNELYSLIFPYLATGETRGFNAHSKAQKIIETAVRECQEWLGQAGYSNE